MKKCSAFAEQEFWYVFCKGQPDLGTLNPCHWLYERVKSGQWRVHPSPDFCIFCNRKTVYFATGKQKNSNFTLSVYTSNSIVWCFSPSAGSNKCVVCFRRDNYRVKSLIKNTSETVINTLLNTSFQVIIPVNTADSRI